MKKTVLFIFLTFLTFNAAADESLNKQKGSSSEKVNKNPNTQSFLSADTSFSYFDFQGTNIANSGIYGFENVNMQMQTLNISYAFNPMTSISIEGRHIKNYAETYFYGPLYTDETSGLGDTVLKATHTKLLSMTDVLVFQGGVSLPTGAIDKKSPYDPTGQTNYPYNMQLGTGTYDPVLALTYLKTLDVKHQLGAFAQGKFRTGRTDYDYRIGNEYKGSIWYSYILSPYFTPRASFSLTNNQGVVGADSTYGRIEAMEFYHNTRDYWDFTVSATSKVDLGAGFQLNAMAGVPLWQAFNNVDDIELEARWYAQVSVGYKKPL